MLREVELQENADDAMLLRGAVDPRGVPLFRDSAGDAASPIFANHDNNFARRVLAALAAEPLLLKTVVGVVLGIVVGSISRALDPTPRAVELIGFPGELFMRLLRALAGLALFTSRLY
jgi:hypothetical protein